MSIQVQGPSGNKAEVDAKNNLKSNTYTANTVVNHGTFGVTATTAAIGGRINVSGYKYIAIFFNMTMTVASKQFYILPSGSHTASGNLYPIPMPNVSSPLGADVILTGQLSSNSTNLPSGIYANPIQLSSGVGFVNKTDGSDFVNRGYVCIPLYGLSEIQLYAKHNDTGTINTTIDYVLFNN